MSVSIHYGGPAKRVYKAVEKGILVDRRQV